MPQPPLTEDERVELQRLRVEVAALRSQRAAQPALGEAPPAAAGRGGAARRRWRALAATLLIVVGCLLAPLSVVAVWARNQVTNTDRYVETVAPLVREPAIQDAISAQIVAQVFTYIDVSGLTNQAVDALASRGLPPQVAGQLRALAGPIENGVESFTHSQVDKIVQSEEFATAWVEANRVAHAELVKALTGEGGGAVTVSNDTVSVNLAALIDVVKQQLTAAGFELASRIPEVNASFVLFQSADVVKAKSAFHLLDTMGDWLPVIALALLAAGVYVASSHRRALIGAGVGLVVAMVVLALGLAVFRAAYLNAIPAAVLPHDAAAVLYDTVVRFLRLGLRSVLVLGLVVAAGAFLTGPAATAVRARRGVAQAIGWLRSGAGRVGFRAGPVGTWVYANRRALRVGAVAVAGVALVFWDRPTGKAVILLAALLLVVLAVIQFLAQPGKAATAGQVS
jgi:hypothetical protein